MIAGCSLAAAAATLPAQGADLAKWRQDSLYGNGWSAAEMLDKPVRGESGERIGDVKDIIVGADGQVNRIVVEVGGFFEIGDQHIGVPWKSVAVGEDMAFLQVPLREARSGTYSLFGSIPQGEQVPAALTSWRVNELLGDYVSLADIPRYGIVNDVIFDATGKAQAVVVRRAPAWGGYGLYAYPFAGYYPASHAYPLPYRSETVVALQPFDYGKLGEQSLYAGADIEGASAGRTR
jgi:sporulation protein YlmC with PRC-barrel domain